MRPAAKTQARILIALKIRNTFFLMHAKAMKKRTKIKKAPFIIISAFIVLWLVGILADEPRQVLSQAIRICLSCIGIG